MLGGREGSKIDRDNLGNHLNQSLVGILDKRESIIMHHLDKENLSSLLVQSLVDVL